MQQPHQDLFMSIIGIIALPLIVLMALALMFGARPDSVVKPFFAVLGTLVKGFLEVLKIGVSAAGRKGGSSTSPKARTRQRPDYTRSSRKENNQAEDSDQ